MTTIRKITCDDFFRFNCVELSDLPRSLAFRMLNAYLEPLEMFGDLNLVAEAPNGHLIGYILGKGSTSSYQSDIGEIPEEYEEEEYERDEYEEEEYEEEEYDEEKYEMFRKGSLNSDLCEEGEMHTYITLLLCGNLYRRLGIGTQLLAHFDKKSRQMNSLYIDLNTQASNVGAISCYVSSGFKIIQELKEYYWSEPDPRAYSMRKYLIL